MRLPELRSADIRRVNGYLRSAACLQSLEELDALFLSRANDVLRGDIACRNFQSHDFWTIYSVLSPKDYQRAASTIVKPANKYLKLHPVIGKISYEPLWKRPFRLSEFASQVKLRQNPLYQEAYRHLGINYQMGMNIARLRDGCIVYTCSRTSSDFTDRDVQVMQLFCHSMGKLVASIHQEQLIRERLEALLAALEQHSQLQGLATMTNSEVRTFGALIQGESLGAAALQLGVSRETLKERTASIREKLGLETTNQLRASLRQMQATGDSSIR